MTRSTNALVRKSDKLGTLRDVLVRQQSAIAAVLPKHLSAERLIKLAVLAAARDEALSECSARSVLQAVMIAAQLGLDPAGALGSAYLVPYKGECTLIIGYRGMIDLARRGGAVLAIEARAVFTGDTFDLAYGLEPKLVHVPSLTSEHNAADLVAVYAVAVLAGGYRQVDVMSRADIERLRASVASTRSPKSPWTGHYVEMAKKTVVRRLCKMLPMSPELARAQAVEDAVERGEPIATVAEDMLDLPQLPASPDEEREDAACAALAARIAACATRDEWEGLAREAEARGLTAEWRARGEALA